MNDNKPVFQDCASYGPKIEEGAPNGSPVIKVHAEDEDKGVNGQVGIFNLYKRSRFGYNSLAFPFNQELQCIQLLFTGIFIKIYSD